MRTRKRKSAGVGQGRWSEALACTAAERISEPSMAKLRVHCFGVSIDGFGAGPEQTLQTPLGVGGEDLHQWFFPTRVFQKMVGNADGTTGVDNDFAERGFAGIGAWIMGRNMFGPIRGNWPDDQWKGWWGDTPPYHTPVFVLTRHPRPSIQMNGGTTFHFVTEGPRMALERARAAAGKLDVRVGGGVATIRQYLQARSINSTSRFRPFSSAAAKISSRASICGSSGTNAPNTCRRRWRRTWS